MDGVSEGGILCCHAVFGGRRGAGTVGNRFAGRRIMMRMNAEFELLTDGLGVGRAPAGWVAIVDMPC